MQFRIVVASALLWCATSLAAQELVTNGSFDHDLTSWTWDTEVTRAQWANRDAANSPTSGSAFVVPLNPALDVYIRNFFYLDANRQYRTTAKIYVVPNTGGAGASASLDVEHCRNLGARQPSTVTTAGQWISVSVDSTSTDCGSVFVNLVSNNGAQAYFDDVTVQPLTSSCSLLCSASAPSSATQNTPVPFAATATATNCSGAPTYSWDFGDGATTTVQNPTHSYATSGSYAWTLTTAVSGQTCTKSGQITIGNGGGTGCGTIVPNVSVFIGYHNSDNTCSQAPGTSCRPGDALQFDLFTFGYTFACASHIFAWDFGDHTTSTVKAPVHTFAQPGTYSVMCVVANGSQTVTLTQQVTIAGTSPTATLDADTATLVAGRSATLSWSTTNATTATIDHGIGNVALAGTITVTPSTSTTYTLTAAGPAGTSTATATIRVTPSAAAAFAPVVFVHGFCSDASTWNPMITTLQHTGVPATRYNGTVSREDLYYDGMYVRDRNDQARSYPANPNTVSVLGSLQRSMVYTITFYDPTNLTFSDTSVALLDIRDLAGQLAKVIEAIKSVNGVPQVDLVAHSMGGLVSRAYLEGLATTSGTQVTYHHDVHALVTIDTPHNGATSILTDPSGVFCILAHNIQRDEMTPNSPFLTTLNSVPLPRDVSVTSIASRTFALSTDGVVSSASQDLSSIPAYQCAANVDAIPNTVDGSTYSGLLHTAVHGLPETAAWVETRLGLVAVTRENCKTIGAGNTGRLSIPGYFIAGIAKVMLRFLTGSAAKELAGPLAACSIDVVARAESGVALARQTVLADGYQVVSLGVLPADGWHLELSPTCSVSVDVLVGVGAPSGRRHAAQH
jgi:PKD repeat protein